MTRLPRLAIHDPSFSFRDVDWVGFDVDHALIRYNNSTLWELVYTALAEALVATGRYPVALVDAGFDDACLAFCCKGIILEYASGNFLKLDDTGRVCAASHGFRRFSGAELTDVYGSGPWRYYESLLSADKSEEYFSFVTYFEVPAMALLARLVEDADARNAPYTFMPDVWSAFNLNYDPHGFRARKGFYWPRIASDTARYVRRRPEIRSWLDALRVDGKRVFLVTNSHLDYACLLCDYALGEGWRDDVDVLIVNARKPSFFSGVAPFVRIDQATGLETPDGAGADAPAAPELLSGLAVARGNAGVLEAVTSVAGRASRFLYVGDHIHSDVMASSKRDNWTALAVVEEMEEHIPCGAVVLPSKEVLNVDTIAAAAVAADSAGRWLVVECGSDFKEHRYHPHDGHSYDGVWGDFFRAKREGSHEEKTSHYAAVLSRHAAVTVTDVEVLAIESHLFQ